MASTGTNLSTIKAQFKTLMDARTTLTTAGITVGYGAPLRADEITDDSGDLDAIWLADAAARIEVPYVGSQVRHEYLTFDIVHQSIRRGRAGTTNGQHTSDAAAEALLAESLSLLASDPDLSLANTQPLAVIAESWSYRQLLPRANAWGARYTLTAATNPAGIAAPT